MYPCLYKGVLQSIFSQGPILTEVAEAKPEDLILVFLKTSLNSFSSSIEFNFSSSQFLEYGSVYLLQNGEKNEVFRSVFKIDSGVR